MASVSVAIGKEVLAKPKGYAIYYYQNMFGGENISLCANKAEARAVENSGNNATLLWTRADGYTPSGEMLNRKES